MFEILRTSSSEGLKTKIKFDLLGRLALLLAAISLTFAIAPTRANLLFADSFDYPPGPLAGEGPPPGSPQGQGGWTASFGSPSVVSPGQVFPGVFSGGNTASITGLDDTYGDRAAAACGPVTPDYGIVWVGFLARQAYGKRRDGFAVIAIGNINLGPIPGVGLLFDKHLYGIDNDTGERGSRAVTGVTPSRNTVWLVTKLDFSTGNEYLWLNPSPVMEPNITDADATLPMAEYFLNNGFDLLQLRMGFTHSVYQFDELRVGTTFADVVSPF
jgi:hypothetical protein